MRYWLIGFGAFSSRLGLLLYLLGLSFQPEEAPGFWKFYPSFVLVCSWWFILSPPCPPFSFSVGPFFSNAVWFLARIYTGYPFNRQYSKRLTPFYHPPPCGSPVLVITHYALFSLCANSTVNNTGTDVETSTLSARM